VAIARANFYAKRSYMDALIQLLDGLNDNVETDSYSNVDERNFAITRANEQLKNVVQAQSESPWGWITLIGIPVLAFYVWFSD
jgi:hypothetical protein